MARKRKILREWTGDVTTTRPEVLDVFEKHGLRVGRMISPSKSLYLSKHPDNVVFFNGNVFDSEGYKLWWGDIDVSAEAEKILSVAEELGEVLFVTHEVARWYGEKLGADFLCSSWMDGRVGAVFRNKRGEIVFNIPFGSLIIAVLPGTYSSYNEVLRELSKVIGEICAES